MQLDIRVRNADGSVGRATVHDAEECPRIGETLTFPNFSKFWKLRIVEVERFVWDDIVRFEDYEHNQLHLRGGKDGVVNIWCEEIEDL